MIYIWFRDPERIAPYREPLISEDFYQVIRPSEKNIVWILRTFNETSRLYRMIQFIGTNYGIKQVVIVPDRAKLSPQNEIPVLEFFQKTEIALAIQQSTHVFCEAGVMETAIITAKRAKRPVYIFVHDESSNYELKHVLPLYKNSNVFYTNKTVQGSTEWINHFSLQFYLPVFMKEFQTHTTRETIVTFCKDSQWKFQRIASELIAYDFLYVPKRSDRRPIYTNVAVLCVLNTKTPYEIILEATASGIPIVAQWSPEYEEVFGDNCIYIRGDDIDDWRKILILLKESPLFYKEQSQKSARLALTYDSYKEMDIFLNCVFSEIINI
jgi:glycosyltransferase involved in cell wall biosynthesis